jgi:ATP-dependent Lon protease
MGPLPWAVQEALVAAAAQAHPDVRPLAAELPVLPVRNAVLAPGAVAPLNLGRPSSLAAVRAALAQSKTLAIFSQRDPTVEDPGVVDLSAVGCAAQVLSTIEQEETTWIVVRATRWIRLEALVAEQPFMTARVSAFAVAPDTTDEAKQLEQRLRELVKTRIAKLPDGDRLLRMTEHMTALELADLTIANLGCSVNDKLLYAGEPRLLARLESVLALLARDQGP